MIYRKYPGSVTLLPLMLFVLIVQQSCSTGQSAPPRKKMPELTSLQGPESYIPYSERQAATGLPFTTGYVDLQVSGGTETLFAVSLPDAADDSLIINLINTYRPLAVPLLTGWVQQQQYPVLIDLRAPGSQNTQRADYLLQKQGAFSLPVVFLWDSYSARRADSYMQLMHTNPAISITRLFGNNTSFSHKEQGNCFQVDGPVF
jgi:hypothetical protein